MTLLELNNLNLRNSSREQIIALAVEDYKKILKEDNIDLSEKEATEQTISLLNLFGALTESGKEREDEA